jgi:hypothetical protein
MSYSVSQYQRLIAVISTSWFIDWATCWMPKELWVNCKQREEIYFFCKVSRTALEPAQPAFQVLLGDFRVCKPVHHRTFNLINQPDAANS